MEKKVHFPLSVAIDHPGAARRLKNDQAHKHPHGSLLKPLPPDPGAVIVPG